MEDNKEVAIPDTIGESVLNEDIKSVVDLATSRNISLAEARRKLSELGDDVQTYLAAAKHEYLLTKIPELFRTINDPKTKPRAKVVAERWLEKLLLDKKSGLNINIDNRSVNVGKGYDDIIRKLSAGNK